MIIITDAENVINEIQNAPDRLRAEIAAYPNSQNFQNLGIDKSFIYDLDNNSQTLLETKKSRIFISGKENIFRDQSQWQSFVNSNIRINQTFEDHTTTINRLSLDSGTIVKNFHHGVYENATKTFPSNQLLNWNLISYPFKNKRPRLASIADIRTKVDSEDYLVGINNGLDELLNEYSNRLINYTGSREEIAERQRFIFDLQTPPVGSNDYLVQPNEFPFYYEKQLKNTSETRNQFDLTNNKPKIFEDILIKNQKMKNIFQSIKNNSFSTTKQFNINGNQTQGKIYNAGSILNSTNMINFNEGMSELFLLPESETTNDSISDRFVNQIMTIRMISEIRDFINLNSRKYSEIIGFKNDGENCISFVMGYKIEKFLDRAIGAPIQTYYTNDKKFYDTQLKYGRKYIYRTSALVCVLGSSYKYSSTFISNEEDEMVSSDGEQINYLPPGFENIYQEKYKAYVDVEVSPSFQILEIVIDEEEVEFRDMPIAPPQVFFYGDPRKSVTKFFLSPMYEDVEGIDDKIKMEYFTGIYEIYRMDRMPTEMTEMEDNFLTSIDDFSQLVFLDNPDINAFDSDNTNGSFEDVLIPNQKYYYAFKTVTFNGEKSAFSDIYEIEVLQKSDEYELSVSEFLPEIHKQYTFEKDFKRIIKITPNIERLFFTSFTDLQNWKLDDGRMLNKNQTTKFKLRITSKHTGKKIDINLDLYLDDKINFPFGFVN